VHVQVKGEKFEARARVAAGDERERLWGVMAAIWPDYDSYQTKTEREIPVVVLDPVSSGGK
jgi:deazaflavin-dependent oxidoreductase (nitroreductase family)